MEIFMLDKAGQETRCKYGYYHAGPWVYRADSIPNKTRQVAA